ncbi:MAG: DNA polymerase III subunit alpha, partial [Bacteroidales bacterium]|nr:DNA polymerase III subunit alpha [Bacteroidales bacterium]
KHQVVMSQEAAEKKIKKLGGFDKLYRIKLEADYLAKLSWEGAHKRYGEELTQQQVDQITFELHIMKTMGFPGYFLIVMDFIRAAREELDVWVGPGRGSAAGSVVAYCLGITDIDPLKYDLLFERFLNPDRISLPDIDTDFADDGRQKVIEWVTQKYGSAAVAHIITFGAMATKSAISDVGRVQNVPLAVVRQMTGLVPERFPDSVVDPKTQKTPKVNLKNCFKYVPEMGQALNGPDPNISSMLRYAGELEDTIRQTGVHACGIIIGADDLKKYAPITFVTDKDTGFRMQSTQYDGHFVESVGLIKMDFLGLINLRIMKDAVKNIKGHTGEDIDIFKVPIDDPAVYKLYAEGRTMGIFQFESPGMQKYLKELQPTVFEDLIAMNALYRPGPMDYIPEFIERKQGRKPITYDLPCMEKYLKDTYGVTVYQEQVMLLSRLLADFTRGESDKLRKAMGKKQIAVLNELKPKFINQGARNGHPANVLEKIWADWEKFASYAFNKSHATCYSWVSYQTAWLKTHYPAEYMAALLTSCKSDIKSVTKYMDECKSMGLKVKGPDVNNSVLNFGVGHDGSVVFGLGGIKGVGDGAVEAIVGERDKNGNFTSIYDFVERVPANACNRKTIESLAIAGAFDSLGDVRREQFFAQNKDGLLGSEILSKYGANYQNNRKNGQASLFGDLLDVAIAKPALPEIVNPWSDLDRLNREKEVVGIYMSSHPLASYSFVLKYLVNTPIAEVKKENFEKMAGKTFTCAGIVTGVKTGLTRAKNKPYLIATVEDMDGTGEIPLFGDDYINFSTYFTTPQTFVYVTGRVERSDYNNNLFLKISKVDFLADVLKHGTIRNVTFTIDIADLDAPLVEQFSDILIKNKPHNPIGGFVPKTNPQAPVRFHIVDRARKIDVHLGATQYSVELDAELIKMVEANSETVVMTVNDQ